MENMKALLRYHQKFNTISYILFKKRGLDEFRDLYYLMDKKYEFGEDIECHRCRLYVDTVDNNADASSVGTGILHGFMNESVPVYGTSLSTCIICESTVQKWSNIASTVMKSDEFKETSLV